MITNILINAFFGLLALSLSGGVALHDTRVDKVFATVISPVDTSSHDYAHSLGHDFHTHGSRHAVEVSPGDPALRERSHKKHVSFHHNRLRLAALSA